jgi:glutathione S-transferase
LEKLSANGPYALGAQFTLADIVGATPLVRLRSVEKIGNFKIPETAEYARFNVWRKALVS